MLLSRIHILGASGAGVTSLGHALASKLAIPHHDTDDYYWLPTDPPYRDQRPVPDRLRLMGEMFLARPDWVLSGSLDGSGDPVAPLLDRIIFLQTPTDIRLARLRARKLNRYGAEAIGPGGWQQADYDWLIDWAAHYDDGTAVSTDEAAWDLSFDLNVKSQWRTLRAFLPAMIAQGGGSVINIASAAGSIKGAPNRYAYGATKAAVIGITKSVAVDFVKQGIRCNAICPGTVDTPSLNERIQTMPGGPAENRKMFEARQPVGRFAQSEEVAHLAVWLASDESAFVTGGTHVIDGGWTV